MSQEIQGMQVPLGAGKGKETDSPRSFWKELSPAHTLTLAQRDRVQLLTFRTVK